MHAHMYEVTFVHVINKVQLFAKLPYYSKLHVLYVHN